MPSLDQTLNKILEYYTIFSRENEEGIPGAIMIGANSINIAAQKAGFQNTDVFMSEDGALMIVAYKESGVVEVTIEHNGLFDVLLERDGVQFGYEQDKNFLEVAAILQYWERKWDLSEYFQSTHTTQPEEDIPALLSAGSGRASRLSTQIAFGAKEIASAST